MSEKQPSWIDEAIDVLHESLPEVAKTAPATEMSEFFHALTVKLKESYKNGAQAERRKAKRTSDVQEKKV
jgi:hypothetical protein